MKTGKVNYESDFKLTVRPKDIQDITAAPFELVFYTKKAVRTYIAKYDGKEYTHCYPSPDGGVVVVFDNHKLGIGQMWFDVHVPLTDKDFADGVCNYRSTEYSGIVIDKCHTDDLGEFEVTLFPFYQRGEDGKSAYDLWLEQGNEGTVEDYLNSLKGKDGRSFSYADMTDKQKQEIADMAKPEIVNNLEDGGDDKALSAEMGKRLNEMISDISFEGGGKTKISGKLNLTSMDEIKSAQKALSKTNEIAFYLITDSTGKIPSTQSCYNIPSGAVRQLSLKSPNGAVDYVLSMLNVTPQPIGVNVGDLIALTRVKVKVSDLADSIGVSINLEGEIEMYQYKILSMNDAKPAGHSEANAGVMGLMSPWDKGQVNKISGIENIANNALPKKDVLPSRWVDNMNNALETGVYPWCTLGRPAGSTGAYTCIVNKTSTDDGSFYTIEQTAYGREAELGRVYKRIIFQHKTGNEIQYGEWVDISFNSSGGSSDAQKSPAHGGLDIATETLELYDDIENLTPVGFVGVASSNDDSIDELAFSAIVEDGIIIKTTDYSYFFIKNGDGELVSAGKAPNYSERYTTKDEVATAIANAITNTLNTEV